MAFLRQRTASIEVSMEHIRLFDKRWLASGICDNNAAGGCSAPLAIAGAGLAVCDVAFRQPVRRTSLAHENRGRLTSLIVESAYPGKTP
jgi:hypothetical protein